MNTPQSTKKKVPRRRNAEASRSSILQAALVEFSTQGYDGARVDNVAVRAGVSKPLIYDYFGDKEALYAAALLEAYVQIREGEKKLDLDGLDPAEAIRKLVTFTLEHFRRNPWFISILNTENLRGGATINQIHDAAGVQSDLVKKIRRILVEGERQGRFRVGIDPVELYFFIASLCYFPLSNIHTLRSVFQRPLDDAWLDRHAIEAGDMIIRYLEK